MKNQFTHWSTEANGMTLNEIAEELDITRNEVKNILRNAMNKLRLQAIAIKIDKRDYFE